MAQPRSIPDLKDTGVTVAPEDTINEILPFCAQGQEGRDLLSQAEYAQDMQRNIGHQPGIARAKLANKQGRQVSHMAAGLAQFLARRYAPGVVDDGDLDKVEAALVAALDAVINSPAHMATLLRAGLVQPDGKTTTVDEDGLLSAMGGNLLLNSELWLTESGTFTAPVAGWYEALLFAGGEGGETIYVNTAYVYLNGGRSGGIKSGLVYLEKGQEVSVTIGAGGPGRTNITASNSGGVTTFGELTTAGAPRLLGQTLVTSGPSKVNMTVGGGGLGAAHGAGTIAVNFLGGGGGAQWVGSTSAKTATSGAQGSVRLRWHDPAKAAGPLPEPALFAARRMTASRAASALATVNLYDPATGQGSVWREEDAEAQLAEGMISEAAWQEMCAAKAAEEYAEWLASPDTEAERFTLLRAAREAKLAATDYLVAPDYPITAEQKAAVMEYRQALRDLPAQEGAPWDGGGELTPWPEMPAVAKGQDA